MAADSAAARAREIAPVDAPAAPAPRRVVSPYNPANAVTASRFLCLPPFAWAVDSGYHQWATLFILICGVLDKIDEEMRELRGALAESPARVAEELGDLLFSVANLARKLGVEPESALRAANDKFTRRFEAVEDTLARRGRSVHAATLDELERAWQAVKTAPAAARSRAAARSSRAAQRAGRRSRR